MFQDSILAFYQFLKNENRAKNAQRILYSPRSILILLIFVSFMITLSSGSPVTPDDKWRIVFDPGIDAPFNYSTSFAPKVWLYNQGGSLDSTASITYTYFDVNGNLQIATGPATNNGDGSYTGAALNMPDYADKYINVLFSVSADSNTLREQHVFYAGQSNGAHGALWKIEVFNTSAGPSWNGNNQQKIYMKLYSDAGTLYRNNLNTPTIAIWNSGGTSVLSATAMTYEEDGVYSYNISGYANGDYYFQIYNQWSSRQVTGGNTRNTKAYAGLYLEANNTQGDESLPQIENVERKPYFPVDDDYVNITAHVLDNINITSANLYYTVNNQTVQTEPLIKQTDFEYRATLDPYLLEDNIRYRVEVNDGTNSASSTWYLYNVQDHRGSQNMSHSFLSHPVYWFGYSRQADLSVADRGGDTNYDGVYSTSEKDGVAYLSVTQSYPYFKDMTRIKVQSLIMDETGKPIQHLKNVTAWLSNNKTQSAGTHNQEKTMTEVAGESGVYTAAWEGSPDVPNATYVWNEEAKAIWGQYISGEVYSVYIDINNDGQPEENVTWLAYNVGDTFWGSSENGKSFNDHLNLEQGGSCSRSRCHNSMSGTSRVNLKPSCPDCHGVYRNANGGVWPVEKGSGVSEDTILYGNSTGHPRQDIKNATTCGDETCHNVAWGTSPSGGSPVEIPGYPAGTRLNATFRADYPNPMQCGEHHNFKAGKIPVQEGHNKMVACKYCHGGNHDNSKLIKYNRSIMSTNLSNVNRGTPGYVGTGGVNGSGTYAGDCYKDCHRVQVDHSLTGMPGGATENKAVPCDECHQNFNNAPMHQENVFPYSDRESCAGCHKQQGNITPHNASITLSPPRIPATLLHAKETGTNWNNTGTRPYWVENENSCRYCHGRSYNEAYGLGRIRNFMGTNIINDNIASTSYWCASCHVDNGSETHYNYSAMANVYNYSFGVVPPEITNSTWKSDRSGYQDHNALGFINKLDSGTYSDRQCFNCHAGNNSLDAGLDAWQHSLPGKPKHTLSGYVTSISSGSPLSGAAVQAKSTIPNATTDVNGFYRLTALSDGTYIVNASLAGYISNSTIITVSGADVANANISLSPVPPAPTYIPSAPSNLTSTQGNFWVNHTWQAGAGNVTDSYNVNVNGIWINGTAVTYYNSTVGAHNWSNITIWAYNSSGSGQLGLTPASNATQVANNNPVQAQIGTRIITAGNVLSFTVSATDADSDPITYATNATKGTFNTTTGAYSWTTTVDDVGNYTWSFNSSDNYGGAAVETITVTITSMLTYAVSGYVFDNNGAGLGGVIVQNGSFQDTTLASGYYSITGLINGTYSFSYSKTGFNTGYSDVAVSGADVINANKTIYDTTSPAQVTGLTGDIPTQTTVNLTWNSIADANFYQVFRDSNSIGYTMNTYWNDTGLIQNTSYQYWVRANDSYNNLGQNSSTLIITTASPEADCMGCHNSQRGVYPAIAALSFGKHKNVNTTNGTGVLDNNDCRTCHYDIANMTQPGFTTATKTCAECHIQGNFSAPIIQNHMPPRLALSPGANITTNAYCSTCHNNSINQFAYSVNASVGHYGTNASMLKPTVNQTPLPVFGFMNSGDASAYNRECNNCHNPSNASWGDPTLITVPHSGRGTCNECHVNTDASDLHNGSLSLPQTFGCLDCHTNYAARYRAPNITNTNMAGFGTCDSGCHGGGNVNGIMDADEHNTDRNYAGTPGSTNTVYMNGQTTLTVPPGTLVTVTSRINDAGNAGRVGGAEYYIDIDPGVGKGVPMNPADGQFDAVGGAWEDITATIDTANLSAGTHTVYVRGMDIGKQWSTAQSAALTVGNNYIPPVPSNPVSTQGNFWINYTWEAGAGNVTNGYNVSVNGVWTNSTSTYSNNSVGAHGWSNISVYAYNNSGSGSLSPAPASQNTRVANNLPVQAPIGNKTVTAGNVLNLTVSAIDADSDQITYGSNKSKGTLDSTTGEYSWATTGSDVGTYVWYFNSSDSFSGIANETIIVTVNAVPTYIPQAPINLSSTQGNFWINYTWEAGVGNVTNSYNVSVNGIWTNDTRTYSNNSVGAHGWSNITVWAYNSSGNGSLSLTLASQNTQVANNAPVQAPVGSKVVSEGDLLTFTVSATDADSDTITYRTNATKGALDPATGVYSWTPGYTDAGNYVWEFNSSDNFSGVDTKVITVTVINAPLTITSSTPVSDPTTTAGTALTFVTN
ncbi:MAG: carboxypeptidase-like regulatory domain-containing protein, partial [Candidatus Methanoperedens sp.]